MATIINSKYLPNKKARISVVLEKKEALALQGRIKGIHLFCEELFSTGAALIQKEDELYFSIPFRNVPKQFKKIRCQRIEHDKKDFLIYTCHK